MCHVDFGTCSWCATEIQQWLRYTIWRKLSLLSTK
jgi:hypothetical protein